MIKTLIEYTPLLLFVVLTHFYDLSTATVALIICSVLQIAIYRLAGWTLSSLQRWSLIAVVILGSISLFLHNTMIIKLKPTILFTVFSLIGLVVFKLRNINWVEQMYREALQHEGTQLPDPEHPIWKISLWQTTGFFLALALLNLAVAHYATDQQWATFKFAGLSLLTLFFFAYQGMRLMHTSGIPTQQLQNHE